MVCLFVALIAFYWPWLTNHSSFFRNDLTAFWHPLVMFNATALYHGRLPLWNPYLACGIPQIAILTPGIFFPPNWLFAWVPFSQSLAAILIAHQAIAGLGLFLLLTDFGWGFAPAALGATTIALTGYFFSLQTSFALHATAAWFPLCLWSLRRLLKTCDGDNSDCIPITAGWLVLTSACVFMFVTAGVAEIFMPGMLVMTLYAMRASWKSEKRIRMLATAGSAVAIGCLLAMPALLPAVEWARLSRRASGLKLIEVFTWSAGWYEMMCLWIPHPFGDVMMVDNKFLRVFIAPPLAGPYFASSYVSIVAITLAYYGCFARWWKSRYLMLLFLALSLVAALGNNTPIAPFFVQLSHFGALRYPVKLMFFVVFSLSILAAAGLKTALTEPSSLRKGNWVIGGLWLMMLAVGVALTNSPGSFVSLVPHTGPDLPLDISGAAAWRIGRAAVQAGGAGIILCMLCEFLCRGKLRPALFSCLVIALQAGLLLWDACAFQRQMGPADYYTRESSLQQRFAKLNGGTTDGLRVALIQADLRPPSAIIDPNNRTVMLHQYNRSMLTPLSNMDFRMASSITFVVGQTKDMDQFAWDILESHAAGNDRPLARYCQLSSTKYIYTPLYLVSPQGQLGARLPDLDPRFFKLLDHDDVENVRIYKVLQEMPRAYFATKIKWGSPHKAVVDWLADAPDQGFDPQALTILEKNGNASAPPVTENGTDLDQARIVQAEDDRVLIDATTRDGSYLVLTDQFYPGWQATVDGNQTTIYRANALVRAVWVPSGHHAIEFRYAPTSLKVGLWLASLGAACLLFVGLYATFARRIPARATPAED
jgi:hypothetical protein